MEYKWVISSMDSKLHEGDLDDVVVTVHWRRSLQTNDYNPETKSGYYADIYGSLTVGPVDPSTFVPYNELTQDNVESWLEAGLVNPTPAEMDAQLAANIELQKNPIEETLPLPWDES